MKFTTTALAALLLSASTTILAAPVKLTTRDVWVPQILYPTAGTVWNVGETYDVKWALDSKPASVTNPIGKVYLSNNGLLNIDHPLADGFQLTDGSVPVTITEDIVSGYAIPGSDFAVVLMGDSGNASPKFQIVG